MDYIFSNVSNRIVRSEIREILKWTRKPGVISFGGGLPDASLFPLKEITEITAEVLREKGFLALQYGPTEGEPPMLQALSAHMKAYGDDTTMDQICITSSSQQGLDLMGLLFLDEDAPVIMELPSYLGAIQVFRRCLADMHGIAMDDQGMDIGALLKKLDQLAGENKKPRFIYVIPDFQNPSGITMSFERREKLVKIAAERGIPILEDSPYRELSFTGETLPSLWSISGGKGVIMMKTFSKTLFPGMRMGWLVADPQVIEKVVMLKQSVDLCTPSFTQLILAEYIKKGKMKETINGAIECYRPKRETMLNTLEKYMPKEVKWSKPSGGMFLWLVLPEKLDTKEIFMKAIEHNVAYVTGRPFHCDNSGGNTLRLNYSFPSLEQIETGIKHLADTIKEVL
ncbi:MAG TPA: PLP-dependent aminotransferase family protein [Candidatus Deferrimicrobium sp.]|nr:PLP-dependent aminotransferase family protein [Candidatus Deferrimicrobium sp.]